MSTNYRLFTLAHIQALNDSCALVNEWAEKKGWNDKKTPEAINIDHAIGYKMKEIFAICQQIEQIRKHGPMCDAPTYSGLDDGEAELLASFGLMATELAEAAEAVVDDKWFDDHVPSLPAVDAEVADLLIRVFHFCGKRKIDLGNAISEKHSFNTTRPHKHGKKA